MIREFWRTLSFSFGSAVVAASCSRLLGCIEIPAASDTRLLLLIFAVCALACAAGAVLRSLRIPEWLRVLTLLAGGVFLGDWVLGLGLQLQPEAARLAFSAVLTACGLAGAFVLDKLTAAALAVEINDELQALHREREDGFDEDH